MRFSKTRRKVFEAPFYDLNNFLFGLMKVHFDLFKLLCELRAEFKVYLLNAFLIILGIKESFDNIFANFDLIDGYLIIFLDDCFEFFAGKLF